jgi:hypothetical protein
VEQGQRAIGVLMNAHARPGRFAASRDRMVWLAGVRFGSGKREGQLASGSHAPSGLGHPAIGIRPQN